VHLNLSKIVQQTFAAVKKASSSGVEVLRRLPNMAERWLYVGLLVIYVEDLCLANKKGFDVAQYWAKNL
jgi:hypothetical protein